MMIENNPDQELTVSLSGITDKPKSTSVSGTSLWKMATYFSDKKSGRGIRIREQTQILDEDEVSQALIQDQDLEFPEVTFPVDLSDTHCDEVPYICFELSKNPETSIGFKFKPEPHKEPLRVCRNTDELCKGKVSSVDLLTEKTGALTPKAFQGFGVSGVQRASV